MTLVRFKLAIKDSAWITANQSHVLRLDEPLYRNDGFVVYGDGVTPLSGLTFLPLFDSAVDSVNGQTGTVVLDAADVGAEPPLGYTPENVANKDTDGTMAANSDTKYPSQKAVRTYVAAAGGGVAEPDKQVVYGTGSGVDSDSSYFYNSATKRLKIGGTDAALNTLDVDGSVSITSAGVDVLRILRNGGAAGITSPLIYSGAGKDLAFGASNGQSIKFVGFDGNTQIGIFDPSGNLSVYQDSSVGRDFFVTRTITLGGSGANNGFSNNIGQFLKTQDATTAIRVENQNSGNSARAMIIAQGEDTMSPASHARYMAMSVTSTTFGGGSIVGTIVPPNTGVLQTGGNLIGGMLLYADDGPIQLANNLKFGVMPAIYISPYSLNGIEVSGQFGKIGIHNNTPNAFLDIASSNINAAHILLNAGVAPTGGALADGAIWFDGTNLKIRISGSTKTFTVT